MQRISIIVPAYNRAHCIEKAVKSIETQGYENVEIILVDDGSQDETLRVAGALQRTDPRIRILSNCRAKGPSGARNTGLIASTGAFVAFLDSDDVWLEDHLRRGMEILDGHPEVDVLFGNFADYRSGTEVYRFFDRKEVLPALKSRSIGEGVRMLQDNLFIALVRENFFSLCGSIVRRGTLGSLLFDEGVTYGEDRDLAIRLYRERNAVFAYREEPVFISCRSGSGLTDYRDTDRRRMLAESHLALFSKYLESYSLAGQERLLLKRSIRDTCLGLASLSGETGEYRAMLTYLLKSCGYGICPGQPKEFLKLLYLSTMRRNV